MGTNGTAKIIFQPSGRRGEVEKGINIIEASRRLGVDIETLCGEKGVCGKCKVRIEKGSFEKFGIVSDPGHVSAWQQEEEKFIIPEQREAGYRLGCVAEIQDDLLVFVPEESRAGKQVVSKAARDIEINWNPAVKIYTVTLTEPTFEDPLGDFERMAEARISTGLLCGTCPMPSVRAIGPSRLRSGWTKRSSRFGPVLLRTITVWP